MALVSIIIPNYNHARYLPKRIESILQQTFTDYEVILLDDASTDDSLKVIQAYAHDPRFRMFLNSENSGSAFEQWNKGIALAQGELIWVAESDDFAEPTLLEKLTTVLLDNPQVGLAYCQSRYVNARDEIVGTPLDAHKRLHPTLWCNDFIMDGRTMVAFYLVIKDVLPNASAVVFRKTLWQQIGGIVEQFAMCGDWMTWVKMLLAADLGYIAEPLNYFRVHATTVRRKLNRQQQMRECLAVQTFIGQNIRVSAHAKRQAVLELLKYFWQRPERPHRGEFTLQGMRQIIKDVYAFGGGLNAVMFTGIGLFSLCLVALVGPSLVTHAQQLYRRWGVAAQAGFYHGDTEGTERRKE